MPPEIPMVRTGLLLVLRELPLLSCSQCVLLLLHVSHDYLKEVHLYWTDKISLSQMTSESRMLAAMQDVASLVWLICVLCRLELHPSLWFLMRI